MFIGHFGAGLAAKKPASSVSLGTLFLAAQWLDLVWPVLLLLNIEHVEINPSRADCLRVGRKDRRTADQVRRDAVRCGYGHIYRPVAGGGI